MGRTGLAPCPVSHRNNLLSHIPTTTSWYIILSQLQTITHLHASQHVMFVLQPQNMPFLMTFVAVSSAASRCDNTTKTKICRCSGQTGPDERQWCLLRMSSVHRPQAQAHWQAQAVHQMGKSHVCDFARETALVGDCGISQFSIKKPPDKYIKPRITCSRRARRRGGENVGGRHNDGAI